MTYGVLNERTWQTVFGHPSHHSVVSRHPHSASNFTADPNDEYDRQSVLQWIRLADFYTFPHVTLFSSWAHLVDLLRKADFQDISARMKRHHILEGRRISHVWSNILHKVRSHGEKERRSIPPPIPMSLNAALVTRYGVKLRTDRCTGQHTVA